jgi:hypothetical protein
MYLLSGSPFQNLPCLKMRWAEKFTLKFESTKNMPRVENLVQSG